MSKAPIVYRSTHRIKFSELDPYDHVNTGQYATYYVDHRMEGLRDYAGWDLKTLAALPFMVWVRRIEIDFLRPVRGDQEITISSFVREFRGPDALIEGAMVDSALTAIKLGLTDVLLCAAPRYLEKSRTASLLPEEEALRDQAANQVARR